jgi:hypothetical protein
MIYGFGLTQINDSGLLEMKEITIAASAETLRKIARFFEDTAQRMEQGHFRSSHVHIDSVIAGWDKAFPNKDIIIMRPECCEEIKS